MTVLLATLLISTESYGQIILMIEGREYINSQDSWRGVDIERSEPTLLTFRANAITSINTSGYMLQAGDDSYLSTANNLDNSVIAGNYLDWNGTPGTGLCHGMMAGYNINYSVKHNRINGPFYGIVHEGGYDNGNPMVNARGGITYNIFDDCPTAIVVMGYDNPMIYNNTFYYGLSENSIGIIRIRNSNGTEIPAPSTNVKIKNNIFYSVNTVPFIYVEEGLLDGLECDYNVYYCEESTDNEPIFIVADTTVTWDEWRSLGYDTHSRIINPDFRDTQIFVPGSRLNYGADLGESYDGGLSTEVEWVVGQYPDTTEQTALWQVGAVLYDDEDPNPAPVYVSSLVEDSDPAVIEMRYSMNLAQVIPSGSAFTVTVNSAPRNVSSVSISGNIVYLELSSPVVYGDNISLSYARPSVNPLQNDAGILAASISGRAVSNNCLPPVNQAPLASISAPEDNTSFVVPATVTIIADVTDVDGTISKVEYYMDAEMIGESFAEPHALSFDFETTGTYTLSIIATDNMNVTTISDPVNIQIVRDNDLSATINIFPNPTRGLLNMEFSTDLPGIENRLRIIDMEGKPVYERLLITEEPGGEFDISQLARGLYVLIILSDNEIFSTSIVIKE
jgi:hypothetical protein